MNKYVYLFQLRRELSFLTPDDLEAAVRFYEEYFADAGPENEKEAIERLGAPASLAMEIRREYEDGRKGPTGYDLEPVNSADSSGSQADSGEAAARDDESWQGRHYYGPNPPWRENYASGENTGENTEFNKKSASSESGAYEDEWSRRAEVWSRKAGEFGRQAGYSAGVWGRKVEEKAQEWAKKAEEKAQEWQAKAGEGAERAERRTDEWRRNYEDRRAEYRAYRDERRANRSDDTRHYTIGIIIAVCFAAPIILPLLFGLLTAIFALVVGLFGAGIGLIIGGIAVFVSGIFSLLWPPEALLQFGVGMVMAGVGSILTITSSFIARSVCRLIADAFRSIKKRFSTTSEGV